MTGQDLRLDLGDAQATRDGLRRGAVVAGEHDNANAVRGEGSQRLGGGLLDRIGDRNDAGRLAVDSEENGGRPIAAQAFGFLTHGGGVDVQFGEETRIAERDLFTLDRSGHPFPRG